MADGGFAYYRARARSVAIKGRTVCRGLVDKNALLYGKCSALTLDPQIPQIMCNLWIKELS